MRLLASFNKSVVKRREFTVASISTSSVCKDLSLRLAPWFFRRDSKIFLADVARSDKSDISSSTNEYSQEHKKISAQGVCSLNTNGSAGQASEQCSILLQFFAPFLHNK